MELLKECDQVGTDQQVQPPPQVASSSSSVCSKSVVSTSASGNVVVTEFGESDSCDSSTPSKSSSQESLNGDENRLDLPSSKTTKAKKDADSSFTSVTSIEDDLNILSLQMNSLSDLGSRTSLWNGAVARKVYNAFKVKRFIIKNDYILNPEDNAPNLLITSILEKSNQPSVPLKKRWSYFSQNLETVLNIYPDSTSNLADCLHDVDLFHQYLGEWQNALGAESSSYTDDPHLQGVVRQCKAYLTAFLVKTKEVLNTQPVEKVPEKYYEFYLEHLFFMFHRLTGSSDESGIRLTKSGLMDISFATPSIGELVCPQPDFFLINCDLKLLAVVEVKAHHRQSFPSHKGHRTGTKKDLVEIETFTEVKPLEGLAVEGLDEHEQMNDAFELLECQIDAKQANEVPSFLQTLDLKEKKQVRCFLPQLIGQLLASFSIPEAAGYLFERPYAPLRLGIGLVGVKLRFVSMVLKDNKRKIKFPVASDIEKELSVRPHIYLTREINLFKKNHLRMFFEILFALSTLKAGSLL